MKKLITIFSLLLLQLVPLYADNCANLPAPATLSPNGLETTPRMGWDSWYAFGEGVTEAQVKAQADLLVSLGLKALGYTWLGYDESQRTRTSNILTPSATSFPDGYSATNAYVHGDGLKVIMYASPSSTTCAGNPGSLTFESTDATNFAAIGADGLMYDGCGVSASYTSCWAASGNLVWQMMAQDTLGTSTNFLLIAGNVNSTSDAWSNSFNWQQNAGWNETWIPAANIGAAGPSPAASWSVYAGYMNMMAGYSSNVKPGFWIMPDFLVGPNSGWSDTQLQTQFGLDAMWNAPLVLGIDLSTLTAGELAIYKNTRIIAIDQDSMGKMATRPMHGSCGSSSCDGWIKPLSGGREAVALVNVDASAPHAVHIDLGGYYQATDDWSGANLGLLRDYSATLQPYQSSILTLTPASPQTSFIDAGIVNAEAH